MENDLPLPLSAILWFYLAVFPLLWVVSSLTRRLIRSMAAAAGRPRPKAKMASESDFSAPVYKTVTTPMA
jgi:hypothetical protein